MSIRIVIADDHKLMREGLRSLLSEAEEMIVVGEAKDGGSAVRQAEKLAPDVLIMDISMPGLNGIEATRQICSAKNSPKILALSMHAQSRMVIEILTAGASGYLLKDCAFEEVIHAVQMVDAGDIYLSGKISAALVTEYLQRSAEDPAAPPQSPEESKILRLMAERIEIGKIAAELHTSERDAERLQQRVLLDLVIPLLCAYQDEVASADALLTSREKDILVWIKEGKSTAEIGSFLGVSGNTVKFHLKNIYHKLKTTSRSHAIAIAIENKLIEP